MINRGSYLEKLAIFDDTEKGREHFWAYNKKKMMQLGLTAEDADKYRAEYEKQPTPSQHLNTFPYMRRRHAAALRQSGKKDFEEKTYSSIKKIPYVGYIRSKEEWKDKTPEQKAKEKAEYAAGTEKDIEGLKAQQKAFNEKHQKAKDLANKSLMGLGSAAGLGIGVGAGELANYLLKPKKRWHRNLLRAGGAGLGVIGGGLTGYLLGNRKDSDKLKLSDLQQK